MYARTVAHTHTYIHIHTHTYICTHTLTYTHICTAYKMCDSGHVTLLGMQCVLLSTETHEATSCWEKAQDGMFAFSVIICVLVDIEKG